MGRVWTIDRTCRGFQFGIHYGRHVEFEFEITTFWTIELVRSMSSRTKWYQNPRKELHVARDRSSIRGVR